MAEAGVVALDPARLSGLEVYLQGLADGCWRRAVRVADHVAGSGLRADRPVAELERLAHLCRRERDDVAWRRAAVEALPVDLPLTTRTYRTRAEARAAAEALAAEVQDAVAAHPPRWSRLVRLLAELDRSADSPVFAARFFTVLGPGRTRDLPLVLEQAWSRAQGSVGLVGRAVRPDPPPAGMDAVLPVQVRLAEALRRASRIRGPAALGETWCRAYAGLPHDDRALALAEEEARPDQRDEARRVEAALQQAGYGLRLAGAVARAVGWRRAVAALTAQRGVIGLVTAPMALLDGDGPGCDGPEALLGSAAGAITVMGAVAPPVAMPAAVAAGILGTLAFAFSACRRQEPRPNERQPNVDPRSGESRLPSGHQSNPNVDGAGVPLPPAYG